MGSITDSIGEWIEGFFQKLLGGMVQKNILNAAENIEGVVTIVEDNVTQTPDTWNNQLYNTLQSISNTAIMPVAIGIMSIIICYDLISACVDRNNFKKFDTSIFFRFIVKAWVAIYLINNVFTIISALFEVGSSVADIAIGKLISETDSMREYLASVEFRVALYDFDLGDLALSALLSFIVFAVTAAIVVIVMIVTAGRMMEILIYISAAPIPFATMTNKEWNGVGLTYLKNIFALALQAFFIVIVLAIYIIMFNTNIATAISGENIDGLTGALMSWLCYGVLCCFMLLKTGSLSKAICGAH